jgi:hypothetical protein
MMCGLSRLILPYFQVVRIVLFGTLFVSIYPLGGPICPMDFQKQVDLPFKENKSWTKENLGYFWGSSQTNEIL